MNALAVAAPNEAAADAAEQVALAGGNAVDAALAAALVAMVNEVGIVSLSSGGFVTVQPAGGGPAYTVDGWMDMPGRGLATGAATGSTWDVATAYGGGVDMTIGPGSVAVHGSLAAFGEAHRRDGRLPWRELVAPAVEVARGGYRLTSASRYYLDHTHDDVFGWDPESRAVLHDHEGELTTGRIVMPDLVASLELIARDGPGVLHRGELAEQISRDVTGRGGLLTVADLAAYQPVVRPALVSRAGGWALSTTPPPSVGGVCLDRDAPPPLSPIPARDPVDADHVVQVQRAVLGHRLDVLDHAPDLVAAGAGVPRPRRPRPPRRPRVGIDGPRLHHRPQPDGVRGHLLVGLRRRHDRRRHRDLAEQLPRRAGAEPCRSARGRPGTRLLSNMAPTVGRHDDGSTLAIGSPGADRITTAIAQVLAGDLSSALAPRGRNRPRVHVHRPGRPDERRSCRRST